jgi:hypothetical protein
MVAAVVTEEEQVSGSFEIMSGPWPEAVSNPALAMVKLNIVLKLHCWLTMHCDSLVLRFCLV